MHHLMRLWRRPLGRLAAVAILLVTLVGVTGLEVFHKLPGAQAASGCQLNSAKGAISHVIHIQFDNTHFTRDNPNVPSDLEQMPHLLNFITQNGVLLSNHHTPLIAHTATDILTSLTGVYGDRHGVPISNSYRYYNPDGTSNPAVSFAYWTDPVYDPTTSTPSDTTYNMVDVQGDNAPAPWVPYTRAGCNFGAVSVANTVLENIATDIPTVFGPNSTQEQEVKSDPVKATADFVGIGIHCAKNDPHCASANGGEPDVLPSEPYGYDNYLGLFGHKYVAPQISPNGPLTDLDGHIIQDKAGNPGFPGFDNMSASVSLAYVAAMQEHGVPVTYAYISDAHDNHAQGTAYGPGAAGYVTALKSYDDALARFFDRLASDGINSSNTLFVFTADEGDHFVGGTPSPANCDGVTIPCTYSQIGEIDGNLTGLLATQKNVKTPFAVHADSAPNFYISVQPPRDSPVTRYFEHAVAGLTAVNPITGNTDTLAHYMADSVEMKLLHMITADPQRTPTFTMFANPDYYLATGAPDCSKPCVHEEPTFAWNHGDVSPDINTTWLGMVGPGVRQLGVDNDVWSDHTDTRPTMMALLGLKDDYRHDGRVLFEVLQDWTPAPISSDDLALLIHLAQAYKQINAPVGQLGLDTLKLSTKAIESNDAGDKTYKQLESQLISITNQRNTIANRMIDLLEKVEFHGQSVDQQLAQLLIEEGEQLLQQVHGAAAA